MSVDKQKRGCMWWLGSTFVALSLLLGVSILGMWLLLRYQRNQWTDAAPRPVAPAVELDTTRGAVLYRRLHTAMRDGQAIQLELSSEELNHLVLTAPELSELTSMAAIRLEGDHLVADLAAPLQQFPGMSDRFLNGRFVIDFSLHDGEPAFRILSGQVKGKAVPQSLIETLNRHGGAMIRQRLRAIPELARFTAVAVKDSRMTVQVKAENP